MKAQSGLNTPQYVLNRVMLEVLVVGGRNRRDSWQEVPIDQQQEGGGVRQHHHLAAGDRWVTKGLPISWGNSIDQGTSCFLALTRSLSQAKIFLKFNIQKTDKWKFLA